jgi:ubiquinone/menaquinone biosynthesis C-methylase UbiE
MPEFHYVKKYWDRVGGQYQDSWGSLANQKLSEKEQDFIKKFIPEKTIKVLDIGVGNGRILDAISEKTNSESEIYGFDASESMVEYCREKYRNNKKVKDLEVIKDIGGLKVFGAKFNIITAIRALKYNSNWKEILIKLFSMLESGGVIVFTMPKKRFFLPRSSDMSGMPYIRISVQEIRKIAEKQNMKEVEIKSFAKIPYFFYKVKNTIFSKFVLFCENILEFIFGSHFLAREVFYAYKKQ